MLQIDKGTGRCPCDYLKRRQQLTRRQHTKHTTTHGTHSTQHTAHNTQHYTAESESPACDNVEAQNEHAHIVLDTAPHVLECEDPSHHVVDGEWKAAQHMKVSAEASGQATRSDRQPAPHWTSSTK